MIFRYLELYFEFLAKFGALALKFDDVEKCQHDWQPYAMDFNDFQTKFVCSKCDATKAEPMSYQLKHQMMLFDEIERLEEKGDNNVIWVDFER